MFLMLPYACLCCCCPCLWSSADPAPEAAGDNTQPHCGTAKGLDEIGFKPWVLKSYILILSMWEVSNTNGTDLRPSGEKKKVDTSVERTPTYLKFTKWPKIQNRKGHKKRGRRGNRVLRKAPQFDPVANLKYAKSIYITTKDKRRLLTFELLKHRF